MPRPGTSHSSQGSCSSPCPNRSPAARRLQECSHSAGSIPCLSSTHPDGQSSIPTDTAAHPHTSNAAAPSLGWSRSEYSACIRLSPRCYPGSGTARCSPLPRCARREGLPESGQYRPLEPLARRPAQPPAPSTPQLPSLSSLSLCRSSPFLPPVPGLKQKQPILTAFCLIGPDWLLGVLCFIALVGLRTLSLSPY